ncbi:MAG TPA: cytochrome c [Bdellovibrionales bacterium]|nr:cytochrome c [Bdellovibrionales bacterium]
MKKWFIRSALGFIGLIVVAFIGIYAFTEGRLSQKMEEPKTRVEVDMSLADLAEGQRLLTTRGCVDCHGEKLQGKLVVENPALGVLAGPNLTGGKGGVVSGYTDKDWVKAIRFGIHRSGRPLIFMPAPEFYHISDKDLASMIAYMKSAPPVDSDIPATRMGPVARLLYVVADFPMIPGEHIDAALPPIQAEKGPTVEYGRYLTTSCTGCHGATFKGGPIPGVPPDWPPAADISATGNVSKWTLDQFKHTMRTGVTPEDKTLNPMYMPWPQATKMTNDELEAIFLALKAAN